MRKLLLPLVAVLASSCGEAPKTKRDSATVLPFNSDTAFADRYFVADEACQSQAGGANIGRPPVFRWDGSAVKQAAFPHDQLSSAGSLKGAGISATTYNLRQRTSCWQDDDGVDCSGGSRPVTPPQSLKVCTADRFFERTSVEGIGLSSLASLSLARRYYETIQGRDAGIRDAQLVVLPTIETVVTTRGSAAQREKREVITDNLAYAPSFGGEPAFVVFPKGKKAQERGLWKNLNLWEMGWGLAHEYGHHVFRTHARLDDDGLLRLLPIHSFDVSAEELPVTVERNAAQASASDVLGAVNEGFADLFAFYVQGGKAGALSGIDCFAKSRDVASGQFFNGEAKQLSADVLAQFNKEVAVAPAPCTTPAYDDIHIIGAIVAHGVDRLFAGSPAADVAERKAALLLRWAAAIGSLVQDGVSNASSLRSLIEQAVELAATDGAQLTAAQCEAIREVFPVYAPSWLDAADAAFRCGR
jgi:hypothetical protein